MCDNILSKHLVWRRRMEQQHKNQHKQFENTLYYSEKCIHRVQEITCMLKNYDNETSDHRPSSTTQQSGVNFPSI